LTGCKVLDVDTTVTKAKRAGARVWVEPYSADDRRSALVQFPGGYIAEIHATLRN
jgi:predicted lactoylglutathione lyase